MDKEARFALLQKMFRGPGTKLERAARNIMKAKEGYQGPMLAWPFLRLGGKEAPKRMGRKFENVISYIDEKTGKVIAQPLGKKTPGFYKKLFKGTEELPLVTKTKEGLKEVPKQFVKREYYAASEPIKKVVKFGTPFLAAHGAFELMDMPKKLKQEKQLAIQKKLLKRLPPELYGGMPMDKDLMKKAAVALKQRSKELEEAKSRISELEKTAELRKKAEKVIFDMVRRGMIPEFKGDWETYEEKIAQFMNEDLDIAQKALEYQGRISELGEISNISRGGNALEEFVFNG